MQQARWRPPKFTTWPQRHENEPRLETYPSQRSFQDAPLKSWNIVLSMLSARIAQAQLMRTTQIFSRMYRVLDWIWIFWTSVLKIRRSLSQNINLWRQLKFKDGSESKTPIKWSWQRWVPSSITWYAFKLRQCESRLCEDLPMCASPHEEKTASQGQLLACEAKIIHLARSSAKKWLDCSHKRWRSDKQLNMTFYSLI